MNGLQSPFALRRLALKNRMVVSPMCQYSARSGMVGDYHLVHLGRFALGGFGTVIAEATGVSPEGRITYGCPGIWSNAQEAPWRRIADFLRAEGVASGIQLAHAGRKASTLPPWLIGTVESEPNAETWQPVAPSALPHSAASPMPRELTETDIGDLVDAFANAARRALAAGFDFVEIHSAHGYLLNQFLSPLANHRTDHFGGSRENRLRLPLAVIAAVREIWPSDRPLLLRISAIDGIAGGWTLEDSIAYARAAADHGVDLVDVSTGGFDGARFDIGPAMFLASAARIRREAGVPVMAVGLMGEADLADGAIADGSCDLVALGRAALDDPNWPMHALRALGRETRDAWTRQAGYAIDRWPMKPQLRKALKS
jgi:2,4-dienoyl-CoA reductase-like NADH-dependent reductase (Old Yellow Enzyme family)